MTAAGNQQDKLPNYIKETEQITTFIKEYTKNGRKKYMDMVQQVANRKQKRIIIELDDVAEKAVVIVQNIEKNALRYQNLFYDAIDLLLQNLKKDDPSYENRLEDVHDIFTDHLLQRQQQYQDYVKQLRQQQRMQQDHEFEEQEGESGADEKKKKKNKSSSDMNNTNASNNGDTSKDSDIFHLIPRSLIRRYEVNFVMRQSQLPLPLRTIRSKQLGKLILVRGIVTRCTDVKSELKVATYSCDKCGFEVYQEITSRVYMPLIRCPSDICKQNKTFGTLQHQTRGSKFVKFQELSLQEMSDEVPTGNIPRFLKVYVHGDLTRSCSPGDQIILTGILLPQPLTASRGQKHGAVSTTYVEAMNIVRNKKRYDDYMLNDSLKKKILQDREKGDLYTRLAHSIAPEIYGHDDVKRALLLMLVGGITRVMPNGVKIRGDINICLMGDPGVAKSQLLRYIASLSPRGIYTSGKGSSGVGLTAAIVKDPLTNELVLEGGALVLADNGICCIDEFDKMDDIDRTSLYEVMEQQSISIAKAGITTTLNARASVLAAANPAYGRYNPSKSITENINLPAALLSRFDLMFLILDRQDDDLDAKLAKHVGYVHQHSHAPIPTDESMQFLDANYIRCFVAMAKQYEPYIESTATQKHISKMYADLRAQDARTKNNDKNGNYTTPRTLLAILRLSQALARLRFAEQITIEDVKEAQRLMDCSRVSLLADDNKKATIDNISRVYNIIREKAIESTTGTIFVDELRRVAMSRGLSEASVNEAIDAYTQIKVISLDGDKITVTMDE